MNTMDKNDNDNFKIRLDDDSPDDELLDEEEREETEELDELEEFEPPPSSPTNRKVYFLIVLVMLATAFGIWSAYQIIQQRVKSNLDEGATVVSNISKQVDAQFAEISELQKNLENKLTEKLAKIESRSASLSEKLGKLEKTVASINESKSDKKDLKNVLADVGQRIAPVQASFDGLKTELTALKTEIAGVKTEMGGLNGNLQKEISLTRTALDSQARVIESLRNDLSALSSDAVDKEYVHSAIQREENRLDDRTAKLKKDMEFLRYKLKLMEERLPASYEQQPSGNNGGGEILEQPLE